MLKKITPRVFLTLLILITIVQLYTMNTPSVNIPRPSLYQESTLDLPPSEQAIVDILESKYNLKIISPSHFFDQTINVEYNTTWNESELTILAQSINNLPPTFFASSITPDQIILIRSDTANFYRIDAIAYQDSIAILIPRSFIDYEPSLVMPSYFKTNGEYLQYVIYHEWIHLYLNIYPETELEYRHATNWIGFFNLLWINPHPHQMVYNGQKSPNPQEDLASLGALYLINPDYVEDQNALIFFNNHPVFNWRG